MLQYEKHPHPQRLNDSCIYNQTLCSDVRSTSWNGAGSILQLLKLTCSSSCFSSHSEICKTHRGGGGGSLGMRDEELQEVEDTDLTLIFHKRLTHSVIAWLCWQNKHFFDRLTIKGGVTAYIIDAVNRRRLYVWCQSLIRRQRHQIIPYHLLTNHLPLIDNQWTGHRTE